MSTVEDDGVWDVVIEDCSVKIAFVVVNEIGVVVIFLVDVVVERSGWFGSLIDISAHPTKFSWTGPQPIQLTFLSVSNP